MDRLSFGTDGIRGVYGDTLTEVSAFRLGVVLGQYGSLLIGRDTRPSSPSLAAALACGAISVGAKCTSVGLITTPALYYLLTQTGDAHAVMITASHNPPEHNGLKVFTREGKPSPAQCHTWEEALARVKMHAPTAFPLREDPSLLTLYVDFFKQTIGSLSGARIAVDYACGAGVAFKDLLSKLGAEVLPINAREAGERINVGCGALHPERLARHPRRSQATMGIALDGDGDRLIVADDAGTLWNGDRIAYFLACRMKENKTLAKNAIVMTVMSNSGMLKSLSEQGIDCKTCAVGDTAVAATMRKEGLNLGGEQSGHLILGDKLMTGDALLAGAVMAKSLLTQGGFDQTPPPRIYPQVLINLPVADKRIAEDPALRAFAADLAQSLGEGRLLLRASGTEDLVRIMAEHPSRESAERAVLAVKNKLLSLQ